MPKKTIAHLPEEDGTAAGAGALSLAPEYSEDTQLENATAAAVPLDVTVEKAGLNLSKYNLAELPERDDVYTHPTDFKGVEVKLECVHTVLHQRLLVVPLLQRTYEWTKGDAAVMLDDCLSQWWKELKGCGGTETYSLGNLLLCSQGEKDDFVLKKCPLFAAKAAKTDIVTDGHQRLTTFICMLSAACHVAIYRVRAWRGSEDELEMAKEQLRRLFDLLDPLLKPNNSSFEKDQLFFVEEYSNETAEGDTTFEGPRSRFLRQLVLKHVSVKDLFAEHAVSGAEDKGIFEMDSRLFNSGKDPLMLADICDRVKSKLAEVVDDRGFPGAAQYTRNVTEAALTLAWYLDAFFFRETPKGVSCYSEGGKPLGPLSRQLFYLHYFISFVCRNCYFNLQIGRPEHIFQTFRDTNARGKRLRAPDAVRAAQLAIAFELGSTTSMRRKVVRLWQRLHCLDELMFQRATDEQNAAKQRRKDGTKFEVGPRKLIRPSDVALQMTRTAVEVSLRTSLDHATFANIVLRTVSVVQSEVSVMDDTDDETFFEAVLREERFSGIVNGAPTLFARADSDTNLPMARLELLVDKYFIPAITVLELIFAADTMTPTQFLHDAFGWQGDYTKDNETLARLIVHMRLLLLLAHDRRGSALDFFQDAAVEGPRQPKCIAAVVCLLTLMQHVSTTGGKPTPTALAAVCNALARLEVDVIAKIADRCSGKEARVSYKQQDAMKWACNEWKLLCHGGMPTAAGAEILDELAIAAQKIQRGFWHIRNMASKRRSANVCWLIYRLQCALTNKATAELMHVQLGGDPFEGQGFGLLLQDMPTNLELHHIRPRGGRVQRQCERDVDGWTPADLPLIESVGNFLLLDAVTNQEKIGSKLMSQGQLKELQKLNTPTALQVVATVNEGGSDSWTPQSVRDHLKKMYRNIENDLLQLCGASRLTALTDDEIGSFIRVLGETGFGATAFDTPQRSGQKRKRPSSATARKGRPTRRINKEFDSGDEDSSPEESASEYD